MGRDGGRCDPVGRSVRSGVRNVPNSEQRRHMRFSMSTHGLPQGSPLDRVPQQPSASSASASAALAGLGGLRRGLLDPPPPWPGEDFCCSATTKVDSFSSGARQESSKQRYLPNLSLCCGIGFLQLPCFTLL